MMIEDRIKELRDELKQRDEEIDILKGEASKQINQIKESITITIVFILTAVDMAIGVFIDALLGGPKISANKSGNNNGGDKKRWWSQGVCKKQIESCITIIR